MKKFLLLVLLFILPLSMATACSSAQGIPNSPFLPLLPTPTHVPPTPVNQPAMPVFVPPFYNWDGTQISVGNYSEQLGTLDLQELTALEKEMANQKNELRPEQMFVLAIRLYDLGGKDDSVYWFYEAQFREKLFLKTLDSNHVGYAGDSSYALLLNYRAFVKLAGAYINGYAGCDVDNWMKIAQAVKEDNPNPPELDKLFPDAIFVEQSQWQSINDEVAAGLGGLIDQLSQQKETIKKQRAAANSDALYCS